jgi:hypothetical protein
LTAFAFTACSPEPVTRIDDQLLTVACGRCVFEMPGVEGCPWAAEIDGRHYLMRGSLPKNHSSHEPTGICNMHRQARVNGEIRGDVLYVSNLELIDAEAPAGEPRFTPDDIH